MLKRALEGKIFDDLHFFFSSLQQQPTNQGLVWDSDPGTPLAYPIDSPSPTHSSFPVLFDSMSLNAAR